jgi:hypothetical protein
MYKSAVWSSITVSVNVPLSSHIDIAFGTLVSCQPNKRNDIVLSDIVKQNMYLRINGVS